MRTIRVLGTGLLTAALVLGGTFLASAQSPSGALPAADALAAAYVTGQLGAGQGEQTPGDRADVDGVIQTRGFTWSGLDAISSDPRLMGAYSYIGNSDEYAGGIKSQAGRLEITNDLGSWVGTSTEYVASGDLETVELTGQGAYSGLTAYLVVDWGQPTRPFTGIIFPGEMPEPPAAQ